ncbi:hypothetical protein F66182_10145 [Fusarium sp. NRRL 66182]|nr:hypothetical protein F66182_10145 [Fusarium sp. NRRL 66182]
MTDWAKLKVVDLKAELKSRGLPQHGLKNELVARLSEAEKDTEPAEAEEEDKGGSEDVPVTDDPASDGPSTEDLIAVHSSSDEPVENPEATDEKAKEEVAETEINDSHRPATASADVEASKNNGEADGKEVTKNGAPEEAHQEANQTADVPIPGNEADSQSREPAVEEKSRAGTVTTTVDSTPSHSLEPTPAAERQKRKRRSLTPPPTEESIARKRARSGDSPQDGDTLGSRQEDLLPGTRKDESTPMNVDCESQLEKPQQEPLGDSAQETNAQREETPADDREQQQEMDYERDVAPAVHPATSALYIKNFMRPLRPQDVKAHLVELATPSRGPFNDDIVVEFFLDQVRTHGFVIFKTTAAAARVRTALHDNVWPNESNRKPLWVDFVPPDKVRDWIDTEQASGGPRGRSGARWEVIYEDDPDGAVEAHLEEASSSTSRAGPTAGARPAPGSSTMTSESIPLGPRGFRDPAIPTGPRPVRPGTGPGPRPPPLNPGGASKRTNTRPVINYQPVSEDLARRRIENMRSFYTTHRNRDLGREINRYSFENGTSFVDRGKEVFEGIRPPHRERTMGHERRGRRRRRGGGGGGGGRQRSDRYAPPPRDDRRSRRDSLSDDGDARMRD